MRPETRASLELSLSAGVGPRTFARLCEAFDGPLGAAAVGRTQLASVAGVGPATADAIVNVRNSNLAERTLDICAEHGIEVFAVDDDQYPAILREIPDPPVILYCRGQWTAADQMALGMVGTRHASPYGRQVAESFAGALARAGLTIVSGLARGIDSLSHAAAMDAGGRTIAVLGSGLVDIYPPENRQLLERIVDGCGVVCSETSPLASIKPGVFPQRNRIISGLSLGVLVVEAAERSGSLITASHAGQQGRDVFAIPGSILSRTSGGANRLIRDGATLVQSVDQILEQLGPMFQSAVAAGGETIHRPAELLLNEVEQAILQAIGHEATDVDAVIHAAKLPAAQVMATLSVLEMRRMIERTSGRTFRRRTSL